MITIDILLPTYNGEKYLEEQINSILNQSYNNIKLLIRDDRSTDNTLIIIENFANQDNRVILHNEINSNVGLVKSIELLLGFSESNYIMFSDQDDFWMPTKVEKFVEVTSNLDFNDCLLLHSDAFVTDTSLNIKSKFFNNIPLRLGLKYSLFHYYVQGCSTMISKGLKEKALSFPEAVYLHDRYFHLLSELTGKRIYINEPLMLYRQHGQNLVGAKSLIQKVSKNYLLKGKYYIPVDKKLILYLYNEKFPENATLKQYAYITNNSIGRWSKFYYLLKNKIPIRMKEIVLLILKN